MASALQEALALEEVENNVYRASESTLWRPPGARGVFGGQIIGQSMSAAAMTLPEDEEYPLHSIHSYFLLKGDPTTPVTYHVNRLREGRSFQTREVTARQRGNVIFTAQMSFKRPEKSTLSHQDAMPVDIPDPTSLPSMSDSLMEILDDKRLPQDSPLRGTVKALLSQPLPIDVRFCERTDYLAPKRRPSGRQRVWMRCADTLKNDVHSHMCVAAYASDWALATSSLLPHKLVVGHPKLAMIASLDHAIWFHSSFRADEWLLFDMCSPRLEDARGLNYGKVFRQDGVMAMTVVQEALVRLKI